MNEFKDLLEWLLAPIGLALLGLWRRIHGHDTRIAVIEESNHNEQELRTSQRQEMIDTLKSTDGKVQALTDKVNTALIELAKK